MITIDKIFILAMVIFGCCSCAYQYVDEQGNYHVVGLVHVKANTQLQQPRCQIEEITVSTVGISQVNLPSHGAITLGYAKNSTKIINSNPPEKNDVTKKSASPSVTPALKVKKTTNNNNTML